MFLRCSSMVFLGFSWVFRCSLVSLGVSKVFLVVSKVFLGVSKVFFGGF